MFLEVRESNAAARTLYEKAGFEQTGRRHSYYTSPLEDAILYRLRALRPELVVLILRLHHFFGIEPTFPLC